MFILVLYVGTVHVLLPPPLLLLLVFTAMAVATSLTDKHDGMTLSHIIYHYSLYRTFGVVLYIPMDICGAFDSV